MAKKRMSIELNGEKYELFAGFAFLKELNDKYNGEGLETAIGGLMDENIPIIKDTLLAALNTHVDVEVKDIEDYIETVNLDKLKNDFFDFLRTENCTRSVSKSLILLLEAYKKEADKREKDIIQKQVGKMLEMEETEQE